MTTCLDLLSHLLDDTQATFVQAGVDQLQIQHHPQEELHFTLALDAAASTPNHDRVNGSRERQPTANLQLRDGAANIVAELTGIQLQRFQPATLFGELDWHDWFYTLQWESQPRFDLPHGLDTDVLHRMLETPLLTASDPMRLAAHHEAITKLETLSVVYIQATLQAMGWQPQPEELFTAEILANELDVDSQYHRLLQRMLSILHTAHLADYINGAWRVKDAYNVPPVTDLEMYAEEIATQHPGVAAELAMLTTCGPNLAQVMQGKLDPLDLLFPDGDLTMMTRLYCESDEIQRIHTLAQQVVLTIQQQQPTHHGLRILEIGGGTGSMTTYLLPHLDPEHTDYHFTDIGAAFLSRAEERFRDYPFMHYATLDIERDPMAQGFDPNGYDLIIAANVLHATQDTQTTLRHVHDLLAPNGSLVMVEVTTTQPWIDLVFGLTDGWWRFTDTDLRHEHSRCSLVSNGSSN